MERRGLTLFEIVVSTILMAIIVTGLVSISVAGKRYILHSRARTTAAQLGKLFLDPLQMSVRQDTWSSNCVGGNIGCPTTAQTIGGITYTPAYNINDVTGTNLRRVRVTISWNE